MSTSRPLQAQTNARQIFAGGQVWVWLNAGALAVCICGVVGVMLLIATKGLQHFWPADVMEIVLDDRVVIGERVEIEQPVDEPGSERWLIKTGNRRENPPDFEWIQVAAVKSSTYPEAIAVIERTQWGSAYGYIEFLLSNDGRRIEGADIAPTLTRSLDRLRTTRDAISDLEQGTIKQINLELEELRLKRRSLILEAPANQSDQLSRLAAEERALLLNYTEQEDILSGLLSSMSGVSIALRISDQSLQTIDIANVVNIVHPNQLSVFSKLDVFGGQIWSFLSERPREGNSEGGVFPAIFGTVLMVLLMSVFVTPIGVITAVYLHEYATQGPLVRALRIAVSNLAGVPSVVYGVFGLGFFVYFLGGSLDQLFYPEALPTPTFGTPGILWASLTLALLTVPVVIVSTEEGLARIPQSLREGSLALGATQAETLIRIILPIASPAILTGVILAVARAAGEVAPLMLVGVVKLAPTLPVDGNFPFLHLERKFMHLGFHIYDVGFQSPNAEAARPLVFATALLLITIIVGLNLFAITLRNRLDRRYQSVE